MQNERLREEAAGDTIDGTTAAFERDHPLFNQAGDGEPDEDDGPEDDDDADPDEGGGSGLAADDPPKPKRGRKAKPDATDEFIARNQAAAGAH